MNHRNENASFMDINVSVITIVLWALSLVTALSNRNMSIFPLILAIMTLYLEKHSQYLRNHASQIAILNITIIIISFIVGVIQTLILSVFGWVVLVGPSVALIFNIIHIVLRLISCLFHIFGIAKAGKYQFCKLPIIGFLGDKLDHILQQN